jgi:hypothetical protein
LCGGCELEEVWFNLRFPLKTFYHVIINEHHQKKK